MLPCVYLKVFRYDLSHLIPLVSFYTPWKHEFSDAFMRVQERYQLHEMVQFITNTLDSRLHKKPHEICRQKVFSSKHCKSRIVSSFSSVWRQAQLYLSFCVNKRGRENNIYFKFQHNLTVMEVADWVNLKNSSWKVSEASEKQPWLTLLLYNWKTIRRSLRKFTFLDRVFSSIDDCFCLRINFLMLSVFQ